MRRAINNIYHAAGALVLMYGAVLMVKAAGLADIGGDLNELVRVAVCGVAAMACGALLEVWKI